MNEFYPQPHGQGLLVLPTSVLQGLGFHNSTYSSASSVELMPFESESLLSSSEQARGTIFSFQQCRTLETTLSTESDRKVVKGAGAQHLHLMCLWHKFTQYFQSNKLRSIQTPSSNTHCSILDSDG